MKWRSGCLYQEDLLSELPFDSLTCVSVLFVWLLSHSHAHTHTHTHTHTLTPHSGGEASSHQPSELPTSTADSVWSNSSQSAKPNNSFINISRINSSFLNSHLTPCPSFNSLNHSAIHSVVPPVQQLTSDSRR